MHVILKTLIYGIASGLAWSAGAGLGVNTVKASPVSVEDCGALENAFGPFDYRDPANYAHNLPIVEGAHFTPKVESLKSGARAAGNLLGDLDYTLRAFPNHHRALYAMARYRVQHPWRPWEKGYTPTCYFDRAIRFAPDDAVVRMIFGIYLHRTGKLEAALREYKDSLELDPDAIETHYNIGLLYLSLGEPNKAKKHAKIAYDAGYPMTGLKEKLREAGVW